VTALELARAVIAEDAEYDRAGYADNALVLLHRAPTRNLARALLSLHAECERMRAVVERVRDITAALADSVESAARDRQRSPGGQHVPFHGEFASAPPSALSRLHWYVRELRMATSGAVVSLDALDASAKEK
jgi:hypothetical protein